MGFPVSRLRPTLDSVQIGQPPRRVKACRKLIHSIRVSECYSLARTLLLDLDGTLIDTVPDLLAALNRLMHLRGLAGFTAAQTAAMVGDGVARLVERACAARGRAAQAADVAVFSADYAAHTVEASRPFPGVVDTLRLLKAEGWRLAVCTNKPETPPAPCCTPSACTA
jgi:hypothetical protein